MRSRPDERSVATADRRIRKRCERGFMEDEIQVIEECRSVAAPPRRRAEPEVEGDALCARLSLVPSGIVYAASAVVGAQTRRNAGVLLISRGEADLEVAIAGSDKFPDSVLRGRVVAVGPCVTRSLRAGPAGCVSIHFDPTHPVFFTMSTGLEDRGGEVLSPAWLSGLEPELQSCASVASDAAALCLFEAAADALSAHFPTQAGRDGRILRLLRQLQELTPEEYEHDTVVEALGLSPSRLSHLFSEHAGLPLRSFLLWRKIRRALTLFEAGGSITAIAHASGFTDSAHFCRTFVSCLGLRPSMFGPDRAVSVRDVSRPLAIPAVGYRAT